MSRKQKQSSSELLFSYINNSARIGRKIKRILEAEIDNLQTELAKPISPNRRAECVRMLAELLQLTERALSDGSKLLVKPRMGDGTPEPKDDTPSADAVMQELLKGKSKSGSRP